MRQLLRQRASVPKWQVSKSDEDLTAYKLFREKTKLEVIKAKEQACDKLYDELNRPEGQQKIYRLAKARDEAKKDGYQGLFVKDQN